MNAALTEPGPWSARHLMAVVLLIFITQLALIFWLSDRTPRTQRVAAKVPGLVLLPARSHPLLALEDPTLFAVPRPEGFSGLAWLKPVQSINRPFEWTEDYQFLPLAAGQLGASYREFIVTTSAAQTPWGGRSEPPLTPPGGGGIEGPPAQSSLRLTGGLLSRTLLTRPELRPFPASELLTNSIVRLVVAPGGQPVSLTLVASSGSREADQFALNQARAVRFAPEPAPAESNLAQRLSSLTWGEMIFEWATLPLAVTNGASATIP